MPPDKTPITRTDLSVVSGEIKLLRQFMENEISHQAEDVKDLKGWRDQFMAESGPWRRMDNRVQDLEYLARSVKWAAGAMMPIALWAVIEIIKAIGAVLHLGGS